MKELLIQGQIGEYGCMVYSSIKVSEDYTMNEVIKAVKEQDFKTFRIVENENMKKFVKVI